MSGGVDRESKNGYSSVKIGSRGHEQMTNTGFIESAYVVLRQAGEPLCAEEIVSAALRLGLLSTSGKTPHATMSAALYVDIKKGGSRFHKEGKGKFGLKEWSKQPVGAGGPVRKASFKDAAYEVLRAERRPLSAQEITSAALRRGLLRTAGKTPDATLSARLYMDIKTRQAESAFVQLGKNRFGLREWPIDSEVWNRDESPIEKSKGTVTGELSDDDLAPIAAKGVIERKRSSIVGDPLNYEGLIYGPLNEGGVIFLFSKIHHKLGINIEAVQAGFPDAKGRRKTPKGWVDVWIEFEFKSSHFKAHKHDPNGCDAIVCWEHDWKDCPIEVIELKSEVEKLKGRSL